MILAVVSICVASSVGAFVAGAPLDSARQQASINISAVSRGRSAVEQLNLKLDELGDNLTLADLDKLGRNKRTSRREDKQSHQEWMNPDDSETSALHRTVTMATYSPVPIASSGDTGTISEQEETPEVRGDPPVSEAADEQQTESVSGIDSENVLEEDTESAS
mmetsp:Transcript_7676/g.16380  ORF Transcript_7676/g.16380 Transcript_7676/m.16380 type:complete len:163 (-) Transcript_7676:1264-1752(-)